MAKYFCNPLNTSYAYQFNQSGDKCSLNRESADPSMVLFQGKYYLFPSMNRGFFVSEDLAAWRFCPYGSELPAYDYAPDVRVAGEWLYFSASRRGTVCDFYRTKDPESGVFERIPGTFDFWDPNLFVDDDGRMYFYWGCSNMTPVYGVELNPADLHRIGEPRVMFSNRKTEFGYERLGEDHHYSPGNSSVLDMIKNRMAKQLGCAPEEIRDTEFILQHTPEQYREQLKAALGDNPYIEGAWMTKHQGKYYLQYACPGAQYNTYNDGVYVGETPLGPFEPAKNNPFSYSPGGFFPGAGHGSTMEDREGAWWHTSTMRISVNHTFERRVGIWPAGFDRDGELFCNQRYGDWPRSVEQSRTNPWAEPEWMLLSWGKQVTASSEEKPAGNAVDENVQTWWKAKSADREQWLKLDLGKLCRVNAVQINFADDLGLVELPEGAVFTGEPGRGRYIEERCFKTRWLLEGSADGEEWFVLEDKRNAETDLPHDLLVWEEGRMLRFLRLSVTELPYGQPACVSGLRVFGLAQGEKPGQPRNVKAERTGDLEMKVSWEGDGTGYEVLWGHAEDKLYHSCRVFCRCEQEIRALVKGTEYFVRVDAFNECGITRGTVVRQTT